MKRPVPLPLLFLLLALPVCAQIPCAREETSRLPAYNDQETDPSREARFEIRRCVASGLVRVLLFEREARRPAVDFQFQDRLRATYHSFNVLVTQTIGGSGSTVRVFWFQRGKAQSPVEEDAQGDFRIQHDDKNDLIVHVPPSRHRLTDRQLRFPVQAAPDQP